MFNTTSQMNHFFKDKRIWLTGASSGIGLHLAKSLQQAGAKVAVTARTKTKLEQHFKEDPERTLILPGDLTSFENNVAVCEQLQRAWDGVDIALLNAGTAEYIDIKTFDHSVFERTMKINFLSMVYGIEAVLPLLRSADHPVLAGMSSTVAYSGIPRAEAYGASKAAVRNMLQALRIHLYPEGINVITICPGFVKTPLTDKNDFPMPLLIEPEQAAQYILKGLYKQKPEIHFPKLFSYTYKFIASLPSRLYTRIMLPTVRRS